jgi:hypothetical protein
MQAIAAFFHVSLTRFDSITNGVLRSLVSWPNTKGLQRTVAPWGCGPIRSKSLAPTAMLALRRRGVEACTNFWPRHWMGWVVNITPRPRFTSGERIPVPIE